MTIVSIGEATGLKPVWIVVGIELTTVSIRGATGLKTVRLVAATGSKGGRIAVVVELPTTRGSVEGAQIAARVVAGN